MCVDADFQAEAVYTALPGAEGWGWYYVDVEWWSEAYSLIVLLRVKGGL